MDHSGRIVTFDCETDGFLEHLTVIHSLVVKDKITGEVWSCTDADMNYPGIAVGLKVLSEAALIIGHNIMRFDIPAIQKVFPEWTTVAQPFDTLVVSRLIWTNLLNADFAFGKKPQGRMFPSRLRGRHSLEAWGYRLGLWKGDYFANKKLEWIAEHGERNASKDKDAYDEGLAFYAWGTWSKEMQDYCETDVEVNEALYIKIMSKEYSAEAIQLEHDFLEIILRQEANGICFDVAAAQALYEELVPLREAIREQCYVLFPDWYQPGKMVFPKKTLNYKDPLTPDRLECYKDEDGRRWGHYSEIKYVSFNPGSRPQIADRLTQKYGWEPVDFTDKGAPKIDEEVIGSLEYEEAPLIAKFLMLDKRTSQLAEGKQAWLKQVKDDGRIYGMVDTCGTVTGRCSHSKPNLAQVPSIVNAKGVVPYGKECRSLFYAPEGWIMVGVDASGLELRCLAHFMARYDDGVYRDELLSGDIHTANQIAAGLPTRDQAKTFIYAFLYGAGDAKIGKIVRAGKAEGSRLKKKFLSGVPALNKLIKLVKTRAKTKWIGGLDGRRLFIRSAHSALNTLLQSAGALVMKKALVIAVHETLPAAGLVEGEDYLLVLNVHDEFQAYVKPGKEEAFATAATSAIRMAGDHFEFRCPLDGDSKFGRTWADTH